MTPRVRLHVDEDTEAGLLGYALSANGRSAEIARQLVVTDFYSDPHRMVTEAILKLMSDGKPTHATAVAGELADAGALQRIPGGSEFLATLVIASPGIYEMALHDLSRVQKLARLRRIQNAAAVLAENPESRASLAALELAAEDAAQSGAKVHESVFLNWGAFWARDRREAEWVFEDVLARGRAHALYASHKAGKSLLMLWIAVQLAIAGIVVIYLDFEMTEDDLYERLEDMGYGPDVDLKYLHYALLPNLAPLDTDVGGRELLELCGRVKAETPDRELVVIIDTTARSVVGEENSADTIRDFYRHTGLGLKQRGITWARLDHSGKEASRGQRGSSAKGDDVDVVWKLARTDNGISLTRELSRMGWVPDKVTFRQVDDPLRFARVTEDWPAGTKDCADLLDQLDVPSAIGDRPAGKMLREAGHHCANNVVRAAQRYRRQLVQEGAK